MPKRLDTSCPLAVRYPALFEFLTLTEWEDGGARETGSITCFFQDGLLKACLSDRDAGLVAFVSADGLGSILEAVEAGLCADRLDWRRAREQGGGRVGKSR